MPLVDYFDIRVYENALANAGFEDLLHNPFIQRLKGVSFISTMDYIYDIEQPFSRYDHSLGAAYLALKLSDKLNLNNYERDILVIAYLLHDVGHGPFSHASETFLIEKLKKYHEGLLNTYLRYNKQLFPGFLGLSDILTNRNSKIKEAVTELLLGNKTLIPIIDDIFFCSINCDKIDGTNRLLYSIRKEHFSPVSMLDIFDNKDNRLYIKRNKVEQLVKFWHLKKHAYEHYIYTLNVLASEAMITRAIEMRYNNIDDIDSFVSKTDNEVFNNLKFNKYSSTLITRFLQKQYFKPLSLKNYEIFSKFQNEFYLSRFNKASRLSLENEIAALINIEPDFVISHFSFKKKFFNQEDAIYQLDLFNNCLEIIPIKIINNALFTKRLSGDVFEIFINEI